MPQPTKRQPVRDTLLKQKQRVRQFVFETGQLDQAKQAVLPELAKIARRLSADA